MLQPTTENGTGAFRQTWLNGSPRERLEKLISRGQGKTKVKTELWRSIRHDEDSLKTIFEYWFSNNYNSATRNRGDRFNSREEIATLAEHLKNRVNEYIAREIKIKLLDMMMPSGKKLSMSSREELISVGGWTIRVANKLRPGQTVAEAGLTEDDLRSMYQL